MGTGLTGLYPGLALVQGEFAYVKGELLYALVVEGPVRRPERGGVNGSR
jgi:hypothetical protein